MTTSPNPTAPIWLDFEALSTEAVDLSPEAIIQAAQLSAQIPHEERQWQTYLNALALFGFEQWLEERATELNIERDDCSVLQPSQANAIEAVCNLKVNGFNLCLIATGSLTDEDVTLPRAAVDLPEFIPHFYVLVDVQEEQETAVISGFLSYSQLVERRANETLQAEEDWTYQMSLSWFEGEPDTLLLYLRGLEASAIPLPAIRSEEHSMQLARMRSQLEALLPQLHSSERQLWQVLTWEQGAVVLTTPELLSWVYQVQSGVRQTSSVEAISSLAQNLQSHLSDLLQLLTQPAVNVGRWLWNELDEFAQELSWVLLPSLAPAVAMRSPVEEFEAIVMQLRQTGVEIPLEARGAYRDLRFAGMPLRLYAVTWPLLSESIPEWTLLLVLGATPGTNLPPGVQIRVSDQTGVLVEQVLDAQRRDSYFFTRVIGTWDEKFIVTVGLPSGLKQTLPPFSFNPEPQS